MDIEVALDKPHVPRECQQRFGQIENEQMSSKPSRMPMSDLEFAKRQKTIAECKHPEPMADIEYAKRQKRISECEQKREQQLRKVNVEGKSPAEDLRKIQKVDVKNERRSTGEKKEKGDRKKGKKDSDNKKEKKDSSIKEKKDDGKGGRKGDGKRERKDSSIKGKTVDDKSEKKGDGTRKIDSNKENKDKTNEERKKDYTQKGKQDDSQQKHDDLHVKMGITDSDSIQSEQEAQAQSKVDEGLIGDSLKDDFRPDSSVKIDGLKASMEGEIAKETDDKKKPSEVQGKIKPESKEPKISGRKSMDAKKRKNKRKASTTSEATQEVPKHPEKRRVFLYLHLKNITDVPINRRKAIICLHHSKHTITKLSAKYTNDKCIYLNDYDESFPTFAIAIDQDSMEDLNEFSDNPLLITLYERVKLSGGAEEEYEFFEENDEDLQPLAQGHIDLIPYFKNKRFFTDNQAFLYPLANPQLNACKTDWEVYALMPIINKLSLCNMIYITCESIYNADDNILNLYEDLTVDLSLLSTVPNEDNTYNTVKICSYQWFEKCFIEQEKNNQKWENLISKEFDNNGSLGVQSGCKVAPNNRFGNLLSTENIEFDLDYINAETDYALVSNALHRYALTEDLKTILEDVIAFNEYHILIEVHLRDEPEHILLFGVFDVSIFCYPDMNACRFAVHLISPDAKKKKEVKPKTTGKKDKKKRDTNISNAINSFVSENLSISEKNTFIIINICLLAPIYECPKHLFMNFNPMPCNPITKEPKIIRDAAILQGHYQDYDQFIASTIDFILRNEYTDIDDTNRAKFCCNVQNLNNILLKLIACDYNVRFPTKTNMEFTNLLTIVYNDLEQRNYNILDKCKENFNECLSQGVEATEDLLDLMDLVKYMYEVRDVEMADFFFNKVKTNHDSTFFKFHLFIYNVEKGDWEAVQEYLESEKENQEQSGDYYIELVALYLKYLQNLTNEEYFNEALENLLITLRQMAEDHLKDIDLWILLHCFYKLCNYLPGMTYTRWRYENLYDSSHRKLVNTPISRWEMYLNVQPIFESKKPRFFYNSMTLFLNLGLYKFAKLIYDNFLDYFDDLEQYFISNTFKIFLNEPIEKKFVPKKFPIQKHPKANDLTAALAQVNGNLEYYRGNIKEAMSQYAHILDLPPLENYHDYQLSLLRYGYYMFENHRFEEALAAFSKTDTKRFFSIIAHMAMGKVMYKLNRLSEAEYHFAESTNHKFHVPDAWGYLALINLRMGNNFQALESWKYAKLNLNNVISDEVLQELDKINYDDVDLFVDSPCPDIC